MAPAASLAALLACGPSPEDYLQERIIEISERVKPSVVHVEAIVKVNDRRNEVTGSGLIASRDGRILTNHHVVEKAEQVDVIVPGRKGKYPARIVGTDKQTDIALLRIEPDEPLPAAELGTAKDVHVGQWVLAVGNPYGLDGTVSFGIVSAKGRNLEIPDLINEFIQTDAMIDRGSSGGPLVDLEGAVIGINSRGQGRGIGFTIPIDTALEVMRQLEGGGVERGWLGITMQPLSRDLADHLGLPKATGVVVNSVTPRSPAAQAGMVAGDIVTHFNGRAVEAEKEEDLGVFQRLVARVPPGVEAQLSLVRDGEPLTVHIRLDVQPTVEPEEEETEVGFHVQEITEGLYHSQRLGTRRGAYVSFVARGSPAAQAGMLRGDVIRRIEEQGIDDLEDFRGAMRGVEEQRRFLVTARRGEATKYLLVKRGNPPSSPDEEAPEPGEVAHEQED
jgi:serine protease Do